MALRMMLNRIFCVFLCVALVALPAFSQEDTAAAPSEDFKSLYETTYAELTALKGRVAQEQSLEAEKQALESLKNTLRASNSELEKRVNQLEHDLSSARQSADSAKEASQSLSETVRDLTEKNAALSSELASKSESDSSARRLEAEKQQLASEVASLKTKLGDVTKRADKLASEKDTLVSAKAQLESKLTALAAQSESSDEAATACRQVESEKAELEAQLAKSKSAASSVSSKLATLESEKKAALARESSLTAQIRELEGLVKAKAEDEVQSETYIFSATQLKETSGRVYTFLAALAKHVYAFGSEKALKGYELGRVHIPEEYVTLAMSYKDQAFAVFNKQTEAAMDLYSKHLEKHVEMIVEKASAAFKKVYAKAEDALAPKLKTLVDQINTAIDQAVDKSGFFQEYPEQKAVVYPSSITDKLCVLGYIAVFAYIAGWVPLRIALRSALFFLYLTVCCGICRRRKAKGSSKEAKKDKKERKTYPETKPAVPSTSTVTKGPVMPPPPTAPKRQNSGSKK